MKFLDGQELAGFIKERQAHQVTSLKASHITPTLLILRDNDGPVINKYVNLKKKYGEDIGIKVIDICTNVCSRRSGAWQGEDERVSPVALGTNCRRQTGTSDALREEIIRANNNSSIHGIILQLPLTDKEKTDSLTRLISPSKDVDGLNDTNSDYDSATATAILWLLTGYDIKLENQKIAIVGRGKLVGAPLYKMLTNSHYNVTQFHHGDDLTELQNYNIIITATGVPGLITSNMVAPDTTIVDAGTASENGIIKGDVSDEIRTRQDLTAITPIIGGVGPLTISCLFDHVIQSTLKNPATK